MTSRRRANRRSTQRKPGNAGAVRRRDADHGNPLTQPAVASAAQGDPPGALSRGQFLTGMHTTAEPTTSRTGGYLAVVSRKVARRVPTRGVLQRRRLLINASKFLLPAIALLLLSSIALWPE